MNSKRPRVSLPAEPASRLKHEVCDINLIGKSDSSRISSRAYEVNGTSAVGIAQDHLVQDDKHHL